MKKPLLTFQEGVEKIISTWILQNTFLGGLYNKKMGIIVSYNNYYLDFDFKMALILLN